MVMIAVALLISTIDTSHLYLTVGSLDGKAKQSVGNDSMTGFEDGISSTLTHGVDRGKLAANLSISAYTVINKTEP